MSRPPTLLPPTSPGTKLVSGAFLGLLSVAALGCSKKEETPLAPAASALASSAPATPAAASWHYAVDPKSTTEVDMPGVKEHIKAGTTAAAGTFEVVAKDLAQSRGLVRVDLTTFSTHTFGNDDDATQTKHARTWLEITSEEMRYADFAIRSVDGLSAPALSAVAVTKDGADDVRSVSMTVHGELLVHGHKVPKDVQVEATFHYAAGAPADAPPARVEVKTKQPMRIVLKEHDVRPRDPAGAVLEWTTRLISKVAETADITLDINATPSPTTQTAGR
jgi:hypothetical protein